jgi:hypothetical protein
MNTALIIAKKAMYVSLLGWVLTFFLLQRLPPPTAIDTALFSQPQQGTIAPGEPLHFTYEGQDIKVIPVATYVISGLVVSHNDPAAWYRFDLTHDGQSLDTRDICLIWGNNLLRTPYENVRFYNDDWACNWSYGGDVRHFSDHEISNNHLITANDTIRAQIARLRIGDQVEIKGKLAYYSEERWGTRMRHSSLSRDDKGNGACEVIFVESLKVIHSHNGIWGHLRDLCYWVFVTTLALRCLAFLLQRRPRRRKLDY